MDYKNIKKEAKKNLKRNYFKNVLMAFICSLIVYGGFTITSSILDIDLSNKDTLEKINHFKENTDILDDLIDKSELERESTEYIKNNYTKGVLSGVVNELTKTKSITFSLLNGLNNILGGKLNIAVIIIISNIVVALIRIFFIDVLEIGKNRYFLEQRRYKTELDSSLMVYKNKKNFKLSLILLKKEILLFLWTFTIVGYFIKLYEYSIIPYILAENPDISSKDAFRLSKELTQNEKFNMFKLDISIFLYKFIGFLTISLFNTFFTNVYKETLYAEVYMNLRKKKDTLELGVLLHDDCLDRETISEEKCPCTYEKRSLLDVEYEKNYSLTSYILLFFTFSFVGWSWEVILHLINDGVFVNRGTMYGPWLPIYGWGGLLILILLKPFRKKPWKLFIMSFLTCGVVEYTTAWYLETFKHLRYWNYSGYFLNIQGRVCLEGLIVFGLGGMAFTYLLAPVLDNLFNKIKPNIKKIICILLVSLYLVDFIYTSQVKPNTGEGISKPVSVIK